MKMNVIFKPYCTFATSGDSVYVVSGIRVRQS